MSKIPIRKYAFQLMIFSVAMAVVGVVFQLALTKYASTAIPFIVIFFFLITLSDLYIVLRKPAKISEKQFVAGYLLSRIVKFAFMFLFLIMYLIFNKEDRWNFAGAFIIIYFAYSIFEIVTLKNDM